MCKVQLQQEPCNKGATSIILAFLMTNMLLVIGLGISFLIVQQIKLSRQAEQAVRAFYAADAGAEKCLFQYYRATGSGCGDPGGGIITETLGNGADYEAEYDGSNSVSSWGHYYEVDRSLRYFNL